MALKARYTVVDGEVIAEKRSGVRHQLVPDPLGSTMALLDNTQTQTDTFTYWPYGEEQSRTGTTATPLRFVGTLGYYRDSSTKTYVRARYLSTQQGRWLTQDPIGFDSGDFNLYRYAENTPVNFQDPSGLLPVCFWQCFSPIPPPLNPACVLCLLYACRNGIVIDPAYGKYCGPQTHAGVGPGIDPLDECCRIHDECFANAKPPCTAFNQWTRDDCKACNAGLCRCTKKASCDVWKGLDRWRCLIARKIIVGYACNTQGSKPVSKFRL